MAFELVPRKHKRRNAGAGHSEDSHPLYGLQHRMNSIFDDFFKGFGIEPFSRFSTDSAFVPQMNIVENDREVIISAELPGVEQDDLEISVEDGALIIKGEKKCEIEKEDKNYYRMERSYGTFARVVQLPAKVDEEKIQARLKKGVLKVTIPKLPEAQTSRKKIEIKS